MIELGEAGAYTQDGAIRKARELLVERNFTIDDEGNLHARMREAFVMGQPVMVPTIVLESPQPLGLKKFGIQFETDVSLPDDDKAGILVGLQRRLFRKASHVQVTAEFESQESTEGMELLKDKMSRIFRDHLKTVAAKVQDLHIPEDTDEDT